MLDTAVKIKKTPAPASREYLPDVWRSFRNELTRLFDRFDDGFFMSPMRRMFEFEPYPETETSFRFNVPLVDVSETEKTYVITAELPGLEAKDIELSLFGGRLTFKGEKHREKEEKDQNYYLSERCYGSFQRTFDLPEYIDQEKVTATFAKGVLTVTLPKLVEAQKQTMKIAVKAA